MSIREKEFKRALRKASSERDLRLRYRKLGEISSKYLKSRYSDSAIGLIERTILNKVDENGDIPEGLEKVFIEAARYYSRNENFDRAEELLLQTSNSRNVTVCLQAKYEAELIKLKRQLEQGTVDETTIEDIKEIVKDDEDHELETLSIGEFSDYDLFRSYFGEKIPNKYLSEEIFPSNMKKPQGTRVSSTPESPSQPSENIGYDEGLSANNRLKFLEENFPITSASLGSGTFKGAILFEVEGSDLVIVENFWRQTRDGEIVEDYGKATYILPKDQAMDLIKLQRGEIAAKKDPRIVTVRHSSKEYYNNLVDRFNVAQSAELQRIEQKSNPLENAETKKRNTSITETKEEQNTNTPEFEENSKIEDEVPTIENENKQETQVETIKYSRDFKSENQEFLSNINENIGGIITPEIMEGLLKRASYSFNDLYENKLKNEIMERLEILEVPEEKREIEAQKVFLYLRMAKNISMINSRMIHGKNLSDLLDNTVIEYEKGIEFFEKHIGDGLSYKDLKKLMKEYIETGIDPLEQQQENQNDNLVQLDDEEKEATLPEQEVPSKENNTEELPSKENNSEEEKKVIDFTAKWEELLEKIEKIEAESERLGIQLAEKEKLHSEKQQATIQAREAEERAKKAAQEAAEQEEKSGQELADMKTEKEKLEQEKKELEAKKAAIEDILR